MTEHRLEVADVFRQHAQEFFTRWGHTLSAPHAKYSETSAPVAPPLSARASNSVTTVLTKMFSFFPAAIAIARSVNPLRGIDGWNERLRNCSRFLTVTSSLRFLGR
jgi:hypothetical protein